jgi:hypothetical protein
MAVLEAKAIITAEDRTGAVFAAIEAHIAKVSRLSAEVARVADPVGAVSRGMGLANEFERVNREIASASEGVGRVSGQVSRLGGEFARLPSHIGHATEQIGLMGRAMEQVQHIAERLGPLITGGAGFEALEATKHAVEAGAERQHTRVGMQNAGMGADEITRAETAAMSAARDAPNMSVSEIMELHKEARSAVQHPDEVFELLPMLAKAASVLKGMGAEHASIADIVKGGEELGMMGDKARFKAYLDGQVRAMNVMGTTESPTQR